MPFFFKTNYLPILGELRKLHAKIYTFSVKIGREINFQSWLLYDCFFHSCYNFAIVHWWSKCKDFSPTLSKWKSGADVEDGNKLSFFISTPGMIPLNFSSAFELSCILFPPTTLFWQIFLRKETAKLTGGCSCQSGESSCKGLSYISPSLSIERYISFYSDWTIESESK